MSKKNDELKWWSFKLAGQTQINDVVIANRIQNSKRKYFHPKIAL